MEKEFESTDKIQEEFLEKIKASQVELSRLQEEISKAVIGQKSVVSKLLIALLANGHVLLEGVPGLAKTLMLKTLAKAINVEFKRIQFTPDMLPADIVGTEIYNNSNQEFIVKFGPVFSNLVLADEINRAPAKVQSALLEAMQEKQVTLGKKTYRLKEPFLVMATQNPIEQEGTYVLPEAQVDRFMMKILLTYPSESEEREILDKLGIESKLPVINEVISSESVLKARELVEKVYVDSKIKDYIVSLVYATRNPEKYSLDISAFIKNPASPRASLALLACSKANAFMSSRSFVIPQDVKEVAKDVLRHRIAISYEAEAENITSDDLINKILTSVSVP